MLTCIAFLRGAFCCFAAICWALPNVAVSQEPSAFPELYDSEPETAGWNSPQAALEMLKLPEGFTATLFAAEPDIQNPIAATVDALGQVWVAENYTYAERSQRFDLNLNDRVVVLADSDGDGVAESRKVFLDSVKMLTGITVGQGGVWLMCPPQLLFVPDQDGDLVPDGPPQVKLDGFHVARENYHNFANGLSWGPDGWLYGRCGASCPGEMGLPGSVDSDRVPIRGGMWRYHPQRQVVEAVTHGTTNPWGHDWNQLGDLFFINTVNGHLWHAIPGAHFVRPHTIDANPYIYELIDMHADHWHFDTGLGWTASRGGAANDLGGGHAHVGMMIYNDQRWPASYQGRLMTINMHGRRVNVEQLKPQGSGYVAQHSPDFALSDDVWFRGMDLLPLPDGNVLLIDWCDTGECHDHSGVHRTSGRAFKISYTADRSVNPSKEQPLAPELLREPDRLAELAVDGAEWQSRRARQGLRELFLQRVDCGSATKRLKNRLQSETSTTVQRLRALWGLYQLDQLPANDILPLLDDRDPAIRGWGVRLLTDSWPIDNSDGARPSTADRRTADPRVVSALTQLASNEEEASVRLTLASTLQRVPLDQRVPLAQALIQHAEDAEDHNLPLMVWYGLTPLGNEGLLPQLAQLIVDCEWPTLRRLIARRVADKSESQPEWFEQFVTTASQLPPTSQSDILEGIAIALAGRQRVKMPQAWPAMRSKLLTWKADGEAKIGKVAELVTQLDVLFGDGRAVEELKRLAADGKQPLDTRRDALKSLVAGRAPGLKPLCVRLLGDRYLNLVAAEGLAFEQGDDIGDELLKRFRSFAPLDRPRVVSILATRPAWARSLLAAVAAGSVERDEVSPYDARQIANLGDSKLLEQLAEVWGQVRETPADRVAMIERIKETLAGPNEASEANDIKAVNLSAGRKLYDQHCAGCHTMFGSGGKLGPDLTGAQRSDLNYLLDNIVDPSAVVTKEFRATIVMLTDGRVLTGLATSTTDEQLTLATQTETHRIPTSDIEEIKLSTSSTMPDGLLTNLTPQQLWDLFGYLQSKQQVE